MVSAVLVVALSLYSPELLRLFTPVSYWPASRVVLPLASGLVLYESYYIFSIGFQVVKNMGRLPTITIVPSVASLVLNLLLIPRWGMLGAAYATLASYFLMAILAWRFCEQVYPVRYEWRRIFLLVVISGAVLVAGWPVGRFDLVSSILVKSLLLSAWAVAVWLAILLDSERAAILRRWKHAVHRWTRPLRKVGPGVQR
jgi:O-antigen/teichoic acid export membrane protein